MASSDLNARQWTHVDALMLASVRDAKAQSSLMDLGVLGSLAGGAAQAGCGSLPVSEVVRRLAPVGFAFQGTSAPTFVSPAALQRIETEAVANGETTVSDVAPITFELQGTTVPSAHEVPASTGFAAANAPRTYKSIATDLRPVSVKGGSSGVPPRGRPDEKG
ncbi:hypothetical protein [Phytomonospora endophytica]|uniref:Uncharacterized protein n=1 Tax=Phytomonospora endophytica TaxID=714109 RepID=A0A841FDL3_9ACTN|nr:hypothetical protein [Phytomonospora endophytica]MBB6033103.1 hypothetical protein [Phytomonospora endophytica]GIG65330.1 hypothetical protein Pen01_16250 [Phytomonospora endophytica]